MKITKCFWNGSCRFGSLAVHLQWSRNETLIATLYGFICIYLTHLLSSSSIHALKFYSSSDTETLLMGCIHYFRVEGFGASPRSQNRFPSRIGLSCSTLPAWHDASEWVKFSISFSAHACVREDACRMYASDMDVPYFGYMSKSIILKWDSS